MRLTPALALTVVVVTLAALVMQSPFGPQQGTAATGIGALLLAWCWRRRMPAVWSTCWTSSR